MNRRQIEARVEAEVGRRWPEFETRHPALAAELGQADYIAAALELIRSEPGYQEAVARGKAMATAAEALGSIVTTVVKTLMRL